MNKELPIGFAMSLALNEFAMEYYASLDDMNKEKITKYIQNSSTGSEAKSRINQVIKDLEKNNTDFLN